MKAAVITFPGSNCEDDAFDTLSRVVGIATDRVWHKDSFDFSSHDLVVLPGGFSYGDYLRCGAMASLSPVMQQVRAFAEKGGFVVGICNGFQILCEAKLLPGALTLNEGKRFICRDVELKTQAVRSPWTSLLKEGEQVSFPIAHGDGRYWIDEAGLTALRNNRQILFTYSNNPNGSVADIAGVCNEAGNVFGLMPHPERATELGSRDGKKLWRAVIEAVEGRSK
jgi:phosphoribosylformylglycinamidine synthase subunit PurQ / glutaminase